MEFDNYSSLGRNKQIFAGLPAAWTPKGTIEIDCKQLEEAVSEGDALT